VGKNLVEIDIAIGNPPASVQVAKVLLVKKGDLYVMNLAPGVIAGKFSYHESGVNHSYRTLIGRRSGEGEDAGAKLRGLKGHRMVTGWGCPTVLKPTGYVPKQNTLMRRTLIVPKAEIGWHCNVWAIESGRNDLAEKIAQTNPWPEVPVVASLLADWSDPWILATVCHWASIEPYQVIKYSPPIPGRVPYVLVPEAFEGTWLESPGPKWRPGQPIPNEWLREARERAMRQAILEVRRARS
jgi:hypothetical protein